MPKMLSLGEVGDRLGVQYWRIYQLFKRKILPEPARAAGRTRLVPESDLPKIKQALIEAGYLKGAG